MMYEFAEFLVTGTLLGFAAGISPGPLMVITISESLQHGSKEGCKVAISPLIRLPDSISCDLHTNTFPVAKFGDRLYKPGRGTLPDASGNYFFKDQKYQYRDN
ncbi:hypothetical protein [Methanohalophilus euhalobius]|nr:hypothetical protein [Methanohalophilus euhalobius]